MDGDADQLSAVATGVLAAIAISVSLCTMSLQAAALLS